MSEADALRDWNDRGLSCHCGKDGHALNSVNCPVHGRTNIAAWTSRSPGNYPAYVSINKEADGVIAITIRDAAATQCTVYLTTIEWNDLVQQIIGAERWR